MTIKEIVGAIKKKKKKVGDWWTTSHAKNQAKLDKYYKYGIREVGWNPFEK